jgi:hypothetical protein
VPYLDDLEYGDEILGVVCGECGASLTWRKGKAYCDEHRYVNPVKEQVLTTIGSGDYEYTDYDLAYEILTGEPEG